ncbi:hypothetical protein FQZ97_1276680 [compost metagenome]
MHPLRRGVGIAVAVVQRRHQHLAQPLADAAVLRVTEAVEGLVGTRIADHFHLLTSSAGVLQYHGALLVRVHALGQ